MMMEQNWGDAAENAITWFEPWDTVRTGSFATADLAWFSGGKLNASYNCLDRHLEQSAENIAIYWQGDNPAEKKSLTYQALFTATCRFANVLKQQGVKKGDRVCIYLPMIPEAVIAMLACARIGAIHSVVFAGFSANALASRIQDANATVLITADGSYRGGKLIALKEQADKALTSCATIQSVIVVKHAHNAIEMQAHRDYDYHELCQQVQIECVAQSMDANDPLFILYTSGSTGKPKGVLHTTGGYLVYAAVTFKNVFHYQSGEIYWCTADVGWITGHSYVVYGPLALGASIVLFEGVPNYPTPSRFWEIIDEYQVNIFYTAPTAIRSLMREGDDHVTQTSRRSLRLLGTVGEPINPHVWDWYSEVVGNGSCPIVDTWWQTETGGVMIAPDYQNSPLKPGSAGMPCTGINAAIVDDAGLAVADETPGNLVITQPWPGLMNTIYGDHGRFIQTYLSRFPGHFYTGDGARRDKDGYFWITGRIDDVINVSGHRLGTAEIESALVSHPSIAEAAVVGIEHEIKGQAIYAYVTAKAGIHPDAALYAELMQQVKTQISAIAKPEYIHFTDALPKTRSGKIMRRILRKIANHQWDELGDTSTLADPTIVDKLIAHIQAEK